MRIASRKSSFLLFKRHFAATLLWTFLQDHNSCAGYLGYPFHKNGLMTTPLGSFPTYPHNGQGFPQSSLLACFGTDILSSQYRVIAEETMLKLHSTEEVYPS